MTNAALAKKAKAHTIYRLADGTRVVGTTTALGIIAKPALIAWANKMGLEGIDTTKYRDAAADAGSACHAMIEAHLKGEEFDESPYDTTTLDIAANGYLKYLEWEVQHTLEDIHSEMELVSETHRFGGTCDLYCRLDRIYTLVDFKTSQSGIFDEMEWQTAGAYRLLLEENGYPVESVKILRLGKTEQPDMEVKDIGYWELASKVFLNSLALYYSIQAYTKAKKGE